MPSPFIEAVPVGAGIHRKQLIPEKWLDDPVLGKQFRRLTRDELAAAAQDTTPAVAPGEPTSVPVQTPDAAPALTVVPEAPTTTDAPAPANPTTSTATKTAAPTTSKEK